MNFIKSTQKNFDDVSQFLFSQLSENEELNLNLHAEDSIFVRFNGNKIRQNTTVEQLNLSLTLQSQHKTSHVSFCLTGNKDIDQNRALECLQVARQECAALPVDDFQVAMVNNGTTHKVFKGRLLATEEVFSAITTPAQGSDLAGLYCAGPLISANKNSKGQSHFFATENFFFDYSIYDGEKAVKAIYAGTEWDTEAFQATLKQAQQQLVLMHKSKKSLAPGKYRTYLAPAATAELASMFNWGALSYNAYRQGQNPLGKLADKTKNLSPFFSLRENFAMGLTHSYNAMGEVSAEQVPLITGGRLDSFLVSSRSAKEYSVISNGANLGEGCRALEILPGTLKQQDILKELGTGLYLSNLHYLNWSDRLNARITGMTRYACFWVENGEIIAPISDLRFDESLYDCLGENLVAVTEFQAVDPNVDTYDSRQPGGKKIPGLLIKDFKFTL